MLQLDDVTPPGPEVHDFGAVAEEPAERVGRLAREAVGRPEVRPVVAAMLAARRLYALAFESARAAVPGDCADADAVAEVFSASTAAAAERPFEPADLLRDLTDSVVPWLGAEVERRTAAVAGERRRLLEEYEEERRASPVPTGAGALELRRDRPLVLFGTAAAVYTACDLMASAAVASSCCVLRLAGYDDRRPGATPDGSDCLQLPRRSWLGAAKSRDAWLRAAGRLVLPRLTGLPDLFVCDDAPAAVVGGSGTWRAPAAVANDALRHLAEWASEAGCALVLGVPGESPDAASSAALARHADVACVVVVDAGADDDGVRLRLEPGGAEWTAPAAVYDSHRPRLIVGGS